MCLEMVADISAPPSFSISPSTFSLSSLELPHKQPWQRCYKQDMGSLEICKQEWRKVFNSISAVNRDKGGSSVWSRQ